MHVLHIHGIFCKSHDLSQTGPSSQFNDRILGQMQLWSDQLVYSYIYLQLNYGSCLGENS